MIKTDYEFEGMSQFRLPFCLELEGLLLQFVMDNRREYTAEFLSGHEVRWAEDGGEPRTDHYDCLKVDDDVFYVNMELAGSVPRTGYAVAIDFEEMLVTAVVAKQDETGRDAYFTKTEVVFGALRRPDGSVNKKRHRYTADKVGTAICWTYDPDFAIIHTYPTERYFGNILAYYRHLRNTDLINDMLHPDRKIAWSNGPWDAVDWIKIKEGIYMFSFVEGEGQDPCPVKLRKRNSLCFVFNLKRLQNYGRLFGYNDNGYRENYMFCAYGQYLNMEPLEHKENEFFV